MFAPSVLLPVCACICVVLTSSALLARMLSSRLAGQQLMAGLGLISDVSDTQQLLAWLEGRPRERFGVVLTHVQDLVMAPAEEHQGFLDLLDNILHVSCDIKLVSAEDGVMWHSDVSCQTAYRYA